MPLPALASLCAARWYLTVVSPWMDGVMMPTLCPSLSLSLCFSCHVAGAVSSPLPPPDVPVQVVFTLNGRVIASLRPDFGPAPSAAAAFDHLSPAATGSLHPHIAFRCGEVVRLLPPRAAGALPTQPLLPPVWRLLQHAAPTTSGRGPCDKDGDGLGRRGDAVAVAVAEVEVEVDVDMTTGAGVDEGRGCTPDTVTCACRVQCAVLYSASWRARAPVRACVCGRVSVFGGSEMHREGCNDCGVWFVLSSLARAGALFEAVAHRPDRKDAAPRIVSAGSSPAVTLGCGYGAKGMLTAATSWFVVRIA